MHILHSSTEFMHRKDSLFLLILIAIETFARLVLVQFLMPNIKYIQINVFNAYT